MTYAAGILNAVLYLGVLAVPRPEARSGPAATTLGGGAGRVLVELAAWARVAVLRRERWMGVLGRSSSAPIRCSCCSGSCLGRPSSMCGGGCCWIGAGCLAFGIERLGWSALILRSAWRRRWHRALRQFPVGGLLVVLTAWVAISNGIGVPVALLGGTQGVLTDRRRAVHPRLHQPVVDPIPTSIAWLPGRRSTGAPCWWPGPVGSLWGGVVFGRMVDRLEGGDP
ncbi:MAG: hypothetical protein U0838_07910 [Chloroflexota bacterium]